MISQAFREAVAEDHFGVLVAITISKDNVTEFVGLSPMSPVRSVTHESDEVDPSVDTR